MVSWDCVFEIEMSSEVLRELVPEVAWVVEPGVEPVCWMLRSCSVELCLVHQLVYFEFYQGLWMEW